MKVKFLIAALFFSLVAAAQPSNYIKFNTRGRWIAGMFDSTLHVPRFNGSPSLRTGGSSMDGAIAIDTTNNIMYFYSGGAWKRANLDTSAYAVTSVYRKTASDSVFYVKGGVHTFAFIDSTGGVSGWALTGNAGTDIATNFIGTTDSVAFLLKVNNLLAGQIDINQKNTSFGQEALLNRNTGGTNNVAIGYRALNKLTNADNNVAVGRMSLGNLTSGNQNTAVGVSALSSIIAQVGNTAIGYQSQLNSTAQINTSVGHSSLLSNTSGVSNTAMGYQAMFSNTTGGANTVMGEGSLYNNTTGSNNTAIGYQALSGTADYNTSVGSQSLRSNISGGFNTSVGYYSLGDNTTGYSNAAIGMNAGRFNTTGFQNSFIGTAAGEDNTTGQENTFVGYDAGLRNTTGIRNTSLGWNGFADNFTGGQNVGIGYGAGKTITNGNNNTILGAFAAWDAAQNDTITGAVIIGHAATASEDSTVVLGDDYIKKTHLKGVVYAPFTTGDATTSDSALVVDRSTGALIMRPVSGSSSYTFTNGLTNSSGTVKLGGTLTEGTTTLDGGTTNTLRFQDMLFEVTSSNTIMLGDSISLTGGATPNRLSDIKLKNDTIKINPGIGLLYIDTLTSAVGTKALRYNPTTGLVSYADTTTGGGGITIGTTAITSGTVGRILFEGSGNVVQQSSNLFWNNTDGELDVFGGGNEEGLNLVSTNANYGTHLVFKYNTSTSAAFLKPLYNGGLAIGTDGSGDYIHIGGILGVDGKLKVQGYVYESGGYAAVINTNHATTVGLNVALKVSQTADAINVSSSGGTKLFGVDSSGKILQNTTITAGGTTGNQTIDKPTGTVNIAAAGTTVTVTNNKCTANSIVYAVLRTNDATATGIKSVVPSAGSFVITLNAAATAEVSVGFIVFN